MAAVTARRTAYGMDSGEDNRWDIGAPCGRNPDLWSDMAYGFPTAKSGVSRAAHACNHHCDRLARCQVAAMALRPVEIVQAGLLWPPSPNRPATTLPESGHGPWCREFRRTT
jgi:hypothetical protein